MHVDDGSIGPKSPTKEKEEQENVEPVPRIDVRSFLFHLARLIVTGRSLIRLLVV